MVRAPLTREQFAAAELDVRREIAARVRTIEPTVKTKAEEWKRFDPEEIRLLDYFIERSFRHKPWPRTAAYFRTYRQLGVATQTFSHAHEALKRLVDKKVLVALPFSTQQMPKNERRNTSDCWHWYGFNLNFSLWPEKQKRPAEFWEQASMPDELEDTLRETFIEISAGGLAVAAKTEMDRDRDAGSAPVPHADKGSVGLNASPSPTSAGDTKTESCPPQHKPEKWKEDLERFKKALAENRASEEFPEPAGSSPAGNAHAVQWPPKESCTPESVPSQGTSVYPDPLCTFPGYSAKPNNDAAKGGSVPSQGTSPSRAVASLACTKEAKLATPTVPPEGTRTAEKVTAAWRWLLTIDPVALAVRRFAEQWQVTCERYPDYVLNNLRGAFEDRQRRLKKQEPGVDPLENALAWLAGKARQEGRMRWR